MTPGTQLGSYEILSPLGKGGMGEVWRARDSKLGREVAIKTLPEEFAKDEERLARFEREAKLLASLNHPNIAAIYGLEEDNGTRFLVLGTVRRHARGSAWQRRNPGPGVTAARVTDRPGSRSGGTATVVRFSTAGSHGSRFRCGAGGRNIPCLRGAGHRIE